jgi:Bifunctional DNA primase/polymerase, N-terminal/Family of unknown function (DUF5906)
MPKGWQSLDKSKPIGRSKNWAIQTGKRSDITVIDIDIKKDKNGMEEMIEAGIDLDDYGTYKIKTQSGGFHYYFKYDDRFKTTANLLPGIDIRNDGGCVFAGDRYEVLNDCDPIEMPDEIYEALYPKPVATGDAVMSSPVNEKYYSLLNLLPNEWFNDFDKWVKPIYALKNAADIENGEALETMLKLLNDRSTIPNDNEIRRVFALDNSKKRFNIGSIVNVLKKTNLEEWKTWNGRWNSTKPKDDENEKKKSLSDLLKEKLLDAVDDRFKREYPTGVIYERQLSYYYTRKYEDTNAFLNHIFSEEPLWYESASEKHRKELISFIKNVVHPEFEFIQLNFNYIGFSNGVYVLSTASFIYTNDIVHNIQVRKFINQPFEVKDHAPNLDNYLSYQFDPETIEFLYFMIGRLMTRLNDKFDFMVLLYGQGGSGKSLLMNLLKYTFGAGQTGILSNSFQEKFGLSEFTDKQLLCCDDLPNNLAKTVPKSDFLSMMTRGSLSCPVKGKGSIEVHDWNIPSIFNSNRLPNYSDESGEIVRRVMIINFENVIDESKRNTNLENDIIDHEIGTFIHRCRSTYFRFCEKYKNQGVESFCPPSFIENRNLLRMATNNSYQFISDKYEYKEGASMTVPELNREFKLYIQERFDMKRTPKDNINAQSIIAADERYIYKKQSICKHCRNEHKKNCCDDYNRVQRSTKDVILNIARACRFEPLVSY